jgi:hypothetical protein
VEHAEDADHEENLKSNNHLRFEGYFYVAVGVKVRSEPIDYESSSSGNLVCVVTILEYSLNTG